MSSHNGFSQEIKKLTFPELKDYFAEQKGIVLVVNFWATWCKPCVEELPAFEQANANFRKDEAKIILVSNDFPDELDSRLLPFIQKKNLKSEVIFMNEKDPNDWLPSVNPEWSGAIPATLIVDKSGKFAYFHTGQLTYEELSKLIKAYL